MPRCYYETVVAENSVGKKTSDYYTMKNTVYIGGCFRNEPSSESGVVTRGNVWQELPVGAYGPYGRKRQNGNLCDGCAKPGILSVVTNGNQMPQGAPSSLASPPGGNPSMAGRGPGGDTWSSGPGCQWAGPGFCVTAGCAGDCRSSEIQHPFVGPMPPGVPRPGPTIEHHCGCGPPQQRIPVIVPGDPKWKPTDRPVWDEDWWNRFWYSAEPHEYHGPMPAPVNVRPLPALVVA